MGYTPQDIYSLLQSIDSIVWEADPDMNQVTFIGERVLPVFGFSREDWDGKPGFWESRIHPDDKHVIRNYQQLVKGPAKTASFDYRIIKADGTVAWIKDNVSVINQDDELCLLRGIIQDITLTKRLQQMELLEANILRLNSDIHTPLQAVLNAYLKGLEAFFPDMLSCVHQVKNGHLTGGVSPSLPAEYLKTMEGLAIGDNEGSCGTAAATKQQVIVEDIATDPKWAKHKAMAQQYHLRASWSNPVIDAEGEVIATVSMYYRQPKLPTEEELQVMDRANALLRIIMENRRKTDIINDAHFMMLQSQELAHFGNWRWDIGLDVVSWSPALYAIYGLDDKSFKATFAGYQERLHPDDRAGIYHLIENVLVTKQDAQFEERIIRPNGEMRYLRSWARLKTDQNGAPGEMIGACLDITEEVNQRNAIEQHSRQLTEIAWIQSHVIRSPLAKILALTDLLKDASTPDEEKEKLLDYLLNSAKELDEQITGICKAIEN